MALDLIAPSAPSQTYARINAAIGAINGLMTSLEAEAQARTDLITQNVARLQGLIDGLGQAIQDEARVRAGSDAAEGNVRASAVVSLGMSISGEAQARLNGIAASEATSFRLIEEVRAGLANEGRAREAVDSAFQLTLSRLSSTLTEAVSSLTVLIDGLDNSKASQAFAETRAAAADLAAFVAAMDARRLEYQKASARPGDAPLCFTRVDNLAALTGSGAALPRVSPLLIAMGDSGAEVRLTGLGILAMREPVAIEPSRIYRPRVVVQRRANPSDPSNDSVVWGMLWLDRSGAILPPSNDHTVIEDMQALTTGSGQVERQSVFSRSASPDALFQAPRLARYARAYVQNYGLDGVTAIQVLGIDDVTNATVLAPETADTVQRVNDLESVNPGPRLDAVEARLQSPNSITYATKSDARSAMIPSTVTTVELRGQAQAGDGGGALYTRASNVPPPGGESFTNVDGSIFVRVVPSADLVTSWLNAGFVAWMQALPTDPPTAAGVVWNNTGSPAVSGFSAGS